MNIKKLALTFLLAATTAITANAIIIGTDSGVNITNDGTNLLPYIPQITGQSAANHWDWLTPGGTFNPGQISQYNSITTSSLPQPTGLPGSPYLADDNGSNNGNYSFDIGSYFVTGHWGGFNAAFYLTVTDSAAKYSMIQDINGTGKGNSGGGFSNMRAWKTTTSVPDSGSSLLLLGATILSVFAFRKKLA